MISRTLIYIFISISASLNSYANNCFGIKNSFEFVFTAGDSANCPSRNGIPIYSNRNTNLNIFKSNGVGYTISLTFEGKFISQEVVLVAGYDSEIGGRKLFSAEIDANNDLFYNHGPQLL